MPLRRRAQPPLAGLRRSAAVFIFIFFQNDDEERGVGGGQSNSTWAVSEPSGVVGLK